MTPEHPQPDRVWSFTAQWLEEKGALRLTRTCYMVLMEFFFPSLFYFEKFQIYRRVERPVEKTLIYPSSKIHHLLSLSHFICLYTHIHRVLFFTYLQVIASKRKSVLGVRWKDWYWSWNSNTLATWCEELTHWKRPWCWERLRAGEEGDDRGWDGWMASPTQWTWVWVNSRSWWWTGRPGVLRFTGSQRVRHDWVTELNWLSLLLYYFSSINSSV